MKASGTIMNGPKTFGSSNKPFGAVVVDQPGAAWVRQEQGEDRKGGGHSRADGQGFHKETRVVFRVDPSRQPNAEDRKVRCDR